MAMNVPFFIICIFFFLHVPFAMSKTFMNTTFLLDLFHPNMQDIKYEGDAFPSNQVMQLTRNQRDDNLNHSTGRAIYKNPMRLWEKSSGNLADFTTHFSFTINSLDSEKCGDGFTFFLVPNGSQLPPNSDGGNLGLVSREPISNPPVDFSFVAVEVDTFPNDWDPSSYHLGIDINSLKSARTVAWPTNFTYGKSAEAWISYDSKANNLSALLIEDSDSTLDRKYFSIHFIVDLRKYLPEWVDFGFSATTGISFEIHNIIFWEFGSVIEVSDDISIAPVSGPVSPNPGMFSTTKGQIWPWIASGIIIICFLIIIFLLAFYFCCLKRNKKDYASMIKGPRVFSYNELLVATGNFPKEAELGEGGFGKVYKGVLMKDMETQIAVKKIKIESQQGMKEYQSEVEVISGVRQRNLVKLMGCCREKKELLIVYEFMPKGSLDFHLFRDACTLTWADRQKIALGLASALFYLQEWCDECVLHRDIKSSNVLLDDNFNSRLGDFGLARVVEHGQRSRTTILIGTEGYMAPEYLECRKASKESDIYSFGIVALEIACGKRAVEEVEDSGRRFKRVLVEEVWRQYGRGNFLAEAADRRLEGNYDNEEMRRLLLVGLSCANPNHEERPSIREAIEMLNCRAPLPELPLEMPVRGYVASPAIMEAALGELESSSDIRQTLLQGTN